MLIVSEASEALEAFREAKKDTDIREIQYESSGSGTGSQKPVGFPSEIADIVIRCLDLSEHYGIDLASIILEKHQYNITRSYKHGGKRI
jgi:NTP pyrophosphatase (non-canonical NTP hydrolase)